MRVLVTGAQGMLGHDVASAFEQAGHDVVRTGRRPGAILLDVTEVGAVQAVFREIRPDIVIHCAAYTAVDKAESESDQAHNVNAVGSRNVATGCEEIGASICAISTDYVFDGAKPQP